MGTLVVPLEHDLHGALDSLLPLARQAVAPICTVELFERDEKDSPKCRVQLAGYLLAPIPCTEDLEALPRTQLQRLTLGQ